VANSKKRARAEAKAAKMQARAAVVALATQPMYPLTEPTPGNRNYEALSQEYQRQVLSGERPANVYEKAAVERQQRDLTRPSGPGTDFDYEYRTEIGARWCAMLELLPHVKGPLEGEAMTLAGWQVFIVMTLYSWVKPNGRRRFRRAYMEIPRGNGKSALSSGLGLCHLVDDADGGAEVYSAATTTDQARVVFDVSKQMCIKTPDFVETFGVEVWEKSLTVPSAGAKFVPLSSKYASMDGKNLSLGIVDELHAHKNRGLWDVLVTGAGKRPESLILAITTAGTDISGICYEVRGYVVKVLTGAVVDETQFGIIFTIDKDDAWDTEAALIKANPNWGISVEPEATLAQLNVAKNTSSAMNNFKTKHLNVWVNGGHAFIDMVEWEKCSDPTIRIEDFKGQQCWVGMDLASKVDVASVALVFKREDKLYGFLRHYLPRGAIEKSKNSQYEGWAEDGLLIVNEGPVTSHANIEADILKDLSLYDVQAVGYDSYNATLMAERLSAKVDVVEVRQNVFGMSEPTKALEARVLTGTIVHDGSPVTTWMVGNVMVKPDKNTNIQPFRPNDDAKIDGAVALIIALSRAEADLDIAAAKRAAMDKFLGIKRG
jgi:phage terminase large subunit-like protein